MKLEVKFGLITGIGICIWVLLEYALGFHNENLEMGKYSGYFSSIIPVTALFIAIKTRRDKINDHTLTLREGVGTGFIISLITAVITTIFFYIYNHYINPGWMDMALEYETKSLLASGMSKADIEKRMVEYNEMRSDLAQAAYMFFSTMLMGLIFSLIISLILRKRKPHLSIPEL